MAKTKLVEYDPRVDAYIEKAAAFAQPILLRLRELVHEICPDVREDLKWGAPHFLYRDSMMCHMAAFKQHCAFGFWKAALIPDPEGLLAECANHGMGHLGKIQSLKDLPPKKVIKTFLLHAMRLNEEGLSVNRTVRPPTSAPSTPEDLLSALRSNTKAMATFEGFSNSHRREYIEWICSAKKQETRERRIEKAIAQMSEGKSQHWKYDTKKV